MEEDLVEVFKRDTKEIYIGISIFICSIGIGYLGVVFRGNI